MDKKELRRGGKYTPLETLRFWKHGKTTTQVDIQPGQVLSFVQILGHRINRQMAQFLLDGEEVELGVWLLPKIAVT